MDRVHQVKRLKNHILFNDGGDSIGTVCGLNEIFLFPGGRNLGQVLFLVRWIFGFVQYLLGDIGGKNPGVSGRGLGTEKLL